MTILYRIFSLIVNAVALMLTISLAGSIPMLISSPQALLSGFMMLAVILYTWFSFRFRRDVLQQQKNVHHSLRDWIRVNGIVTLIFSTITILGTIPMLINPQPFVDAIRNFGVEIHVRAATNFIYAMLIYAVILFIHILWTFTLLKKYRSFFDIPS